MSLNPNRIDVHHHLIPPAFSEAMKAKGLTEVAGAPLPHWTTEKSIGTIDAHGIASAILSLSAPGTHLKGGPSGRPATYPGPATRTPPTSPSGIPAGSAPSRFCR